MCHIISKYQLTIFIGVNMNKFLDYWINNNSNNNNSEQYPRYKLVSSTYHDKDMIKNIRVSHNILINKWQYNKSGNPLWGLSV